MTLRLHLTVLLCLLGIQDNAASFHNVSVEKSTLVTDCHYYTRATRCSFNSYFSSGSCFVPPRPCRYGVRLISSITFDHPNNPPPPYTLRANTVQRIPPTQNFASYPTRPIANKSFAGKPLEAELGGIRQRNKVCQTSRFLFQSDANEVGPAARRGDGYISGRNQTSFGICMQGKDRSAGLGDASIPQHTDKRDAALLNENGSNGWDAGEAHRRFDVDAEECTRNPPILGDTRSSKKFVFDSNNIPGNMGLSRIVVIGLGNIGNNLVATKRLVRHNVGSGFVEYLQSDPTRWKNIAHCYSKISEMDNMILVRPWLYMNESGLAVKAVLKYINYPLSRTLVVHDDLDRKVGSYAFRTALHTSKGHKGVISIIRHLNANFKKLAIGVDRPLSKADVPEYVISPMSLKETNLIYQKVFPICREQIYRDHDVNKNSVIDQRIIGQKTPFPAEIKASKKTKTNAAARFVQNFKLKKT